MKNRCVLISAVSIGGYNDTWMYDVVIEYLGKKEHVEVDKIWRDWEEKEVWKIETNLNLNYDTKKKIIEHISKDRPSIYSEVEPKKYFIEIVTQDRYKSIEEWHKSKYESLTDYLHIGDKIDQSIVDYFINTLQPIVLNGEIIQMGEAYSNDVKGRNTYLTIARDTPFGEWIYKGVCLKGKKENIENIFEEFDMSEENEEEESL